MKKPWLKYIFLNPKLWKTSYLGQNNGNDKHKLFQYIIAEEIGAKRGTDLKRVMSFCKVDDIRPLKNK